MIDALAIMVGITLVVAAFADLINTLVTTSTVKSRWWLSRIVARLLLQAARSENSASITPSVSQISK